MKILVTSDWHLDATTGGISRFAELDKAVNETVDAAIKHKVDAYFFLGDLCDPDSGSSVFRVIRLAQEAAIRLNDNSIPSHWLVGNHDVIEDGLGESTLDPLRSLTDSATIVYNRACLGLIDPSKNDVFVALPFTPTSHAYDPVKFIEQVTATPKLVIGHLNLENIVPGEETKEMPRGREVVFPVAAIKEKWPNAVMLHGHYHTQQTTAEGVHIPGSLARLTFGEETNAPGYIILDMP